MSAVSKMGLGLYIRPSARVPPPPLPLDVLDAKFPDLVLPLLTVLRGFVKTGVPGVLVEAVGRSCDDLGLRLRLCNCFSFRMGSVGLWPLLRQAKLQQGSLQGELHIQATGR